MSDAVIILPPPGGLTLKSLAEFASFFETRAVVFFSVARLVLVLPDDGSLAEIKEAAVVALPGAVSGFPAVCPVPPDVAAL